MPTTRPRHSVTETADIAAAIDAAAERWPDVARDRAELVRRLVLEGGAMSAEHRDAARERHRATVERFAGRLSDVYPPDALNELRADWPA